MNEQFAIQGFSVGEQTICTIDGEDIYQQNYMTGQKQLIGKTIAAYNELEQTTTEYYNKLVELGVITPPQEPEKMMEQMQQAMLEMANVIKDLSAQVKELKDNGSECNSVDGGQNVSQRRPERRSAKSADSAAGGT